MNARRISTSLALAVALAMTGIGGASAQPAPVPTVYVIQYTAGPAWRVGQPLTSQPIGPHGVYMR